MRSALVYPVVNPTFAYGDVMKTALEDSCQQLQTASFEQFHLTVAANRKWKESEDEMVKTYRQLSRVLRDQENEKRQLVNTLAKNAQEQGLSLPAKRTVSMFDSDKDAYAKNRGRRMEKVRSQWKELIDFGQEMDNKRSILKAILDPGSEKHVVNGSDLGIRIPNMLLQDFQKEIQAEEIDNVYIGGRLNLESVAFLWNLCLKQYKEELETEILPDLADEIPAIKHQVQQHHAYLQAAQKTRDEIRNTILPKVQDEIEKLHRKLKCLNATTRYHEKSNNNSGLELIAPTPPLTFLSRNSEAGDTPTGPGISLLSKRDTPDAISTIVGKIEQIVIQSSKSTGGPKDLYVSSGLQALGKSTKTTSASKTSTQTGIAKGNKQGKKLSESHKKQTKIVHARPPTAGKASEQKKVKPLSNFTSTSVTPKTRKQMAEDTLANWIVDSVLESDTSHRDLGSPEMNSLNDSIFKGSPHVLDQEAFVSKDLLNRTPQQSTLSSSSKKPPSRDLMNQNIHMGDPSPRSSLTTPLWERLSPSIGKKASEVTSDLFSPVVSVSSESHADLTASTSNKSEHNFSASQTLSPLSSPLLARDANLDQATTLQLSDPGDNKRQSELDASSKRVSKSESASYLPDGENDTEDLKNVYRGLTRFPGDGQTSHNYQNSVSTSDHSDEATEMESMSKDSLCDPIISETPASNPLTLIDNLENTQPLSSNQTASDTANNTSNSNQMPLRENGDDGKLLTWDFSNVSSQDLLDLDGGDDLMHCLDDSFSPAKKGIVVESGRSSCRDSHEVNHEEKICLSEPSVFVTKAYKNDSVASTSHTSLTVSGSNNILAQMALLQKRLANIVNESSEED
ncbi:HAUS augmin-like complex subunit 6 [Plakobranchus ocellatus]|uniref:HAUS augmin-like complex subunit 6 n=1 Tax=Plakobranchus ocellatus TaxID=259542 RepID=A0AAV4BN79_9GAST|nr:HAUS augmin-like complex subunit 6 [Plakobranchus ocellatus]